MSVWDIILQNFYNKFLYAFISSLLPIHVTGLVLVTVLLPALSIPFLYVLPKKVNPGWIISAIGLLQIGLSTYILLAVYQGATFHQAWLWFVLPHVHPLHLGIYVDTLSALLLVMVSVISWFVALYSIAYLPAHANSKRYFSLYSLALTAMCWLLVADNLWGILLGWELLSISSCLLIGFWYPSYTAMQASTYTWVVSKLGSTCFLVGILLIVVELGNCDLSTLAAGEFSLTSHLSNKRSIAGYCLLLAAFTKSTQFPFFSWLPRAMVAPTPVSAFLHTASVLSAGIYLLVRIQPILHVELNALLIIIGYVTALVGASAALAQQQLKSMLAYSTLSHLGYIVAAIGLGNASIGVIYLVVHAFAKACLFLIAGVIARFLQTHGVAKKEIYTMAYMGGMLRRLPWVAISYLIAAGGLGVLPGFIGFRAKESILVQTFLWASHVPGGYLGYIIPLFALVSNGLTILYMGQAFVRTFLGKPRWEISPSALSSLSSPWLLQGSMVMCAGCVLLSSYLLNNWITSTAASFLPSLQLHYDVIASPFRTEANLGGRSNQMEAWPSIAPPGYERIGHITQLISYGFLVLILLWLVISRSKSTTWAAKATPRPYNNHTPVIPGEAGTSKGSSLCRPVEVWEIIQETVAQAWLPWPFRPRNDKLAPLKELRHVLYQLFLHGWYLGPLTTFLARQVIACSRLALQAEKWFFSGIVKGFTTGYIAMAYMAHWVDNRLIAGVGNGVAILSQQGSKLYLHLQSGRTQLYILWTCIGMGVLVAIWMILW